MFRLLLTRPLSEPEINAWTTLSEREQASGFELVRRSEWLSWRGIVRRELGLPQLRFAYSDCGAPSIEGSALHLSVSHCEDSVAVALSEGPCAVDVEPLARDFGRVAARYLSAGERILSDDPLWPAVVWCAKETLYKFAGRRGVDWLRDLRIEQVDFPDGRLVGRIGSGEALTLRFLLLAGRVVVFLS